MALSHQNPKPLLTTNIRLKELHLKTHIVNILEIN